MAISFITPAVQQRIEEQERGRHARLLQRARAMHVKVDVNYCAATSCTMWEPAVQGRCNVVTQDECSCREFALWGDCPHHTLFLEIADRVHGGPSHVWGFSR